jgi:multidrug efflux pump subunit AcrA (membrane-fusion protein)
MRRSKVGLICGLLIIVTTIIGILAWFLANRGVFKDKMPTFLRALSDTSSLPTLELQGNVEIREVRLGFEVLGRIADMLVDEGDKVAPGQLIAKL